MPPAYLGLYSFIYPFIQSVCMYADPSVSEQLCQSFAISKPYDGRDHFLARFRDILAFFCKKSHQNSRSEKKNRTLNFSHFAPLSSYFAHAAHFETIGLFCLTGF